MPKDFGKLKPGSIPEKVSQGSTFAAPRHDFWVIYGYANPLSLNRGSHKQSCAYIGRSGLKGWIAADILRANGVNISPKIMGMLFPSSSTKRKVAPQPLPIKKIGPKSGQSLNLLAVVREISRGTKRTAELDLLGGVGAKLFNLPKGKLWQVTLVVNSERPNLS
jgi:hypothetical protein